MNSTEEHRPTKKSRRITVGILLVAISSIGIWYWLGEQAIMREQEIKHSLEELGAIVVLDSSQQHVASLNLSTLKTLEDITASLKFLPELPRLTSFDASRTLIEDSHLEAIGQLRDLTSLALSETNISDSGVAHLEHLGALKTLALTSTKVTPAAMSSISRLHSLEILDLTGTSITEGLEPLAKLPHLEWVVLRNTNLKDSGLAALAKCSGLHRVSLEGSTYSAESLKLLLKELPTLVVDQSNN